MPDKDKMLRLVVTDDIRAHMDTITAAIDQLPIPIIRAGVSEAAIMRIATHMLNDHIDDISQADAEAYAQLHQAGNDGASLYAFDAETYNILSDIAEEMYKRDYNLPYLKAGHGWNRRMILSIALGFTGSNIDRILQNWRGDHATIDPQTAGAPRRDT
jgi:hypothetical protein